MLFKYLTNHYKRIAFYKARLAEIQRQQSRIKAAYDLHRQVLREYGIEAWVYMRPAEDIIKDDKQINIINYLDI